MLTGKQRSYLKGLAQKIEPTVYIGKADLTENIVRSIDENLTANELVKGQIQEGSLLDPTEVCSELAETLHAEEYDSPCCEAHSYAFSHLPLLPA